MQLYTDYQCLAKAGVTGSYYRVTKTGNPDKRYKRAKEMESRYGEGLARVRQEKLKNSRGIAESRREIKNPAYLTGWLDFLSYLFAYHHLF